MVYISVVSLKKVQLHMLVYERFDDYFIPSCLYDSNYSLVVLHVCFFEDNLFYFMLCCIQTETVVFLTLYALCVAYF